MSYADLVFKVYFYARSRWIHILLQVFTIVLKNISAQCGIRSNTIFFLTHVTHATYMRNVRNETYAMNTVYSLSACFQVKPLMLNGFFYLFL